VKTIKMKRETLAGFAFIGLTATTCAFGQSPQDSRCQSTKEILARNSIAKAIDSPSPKDLDSGRGANPIVAVPIVQARPEQAQTKQPMSGSLGVRVWCNHTVGLGFDETWIEWVQIAHNKPVNSGNVFAGNLNDHGGAEKQGVAVGPFPWSLLPGESCEYVVAICGTDHSFFADLLRDLGKLGDAAFSDYTLGTATSVTEWIAKKLEGDKGVIGTIRVRFQNKEGTISYSSEPVRATEDRGIDSRSGFHSYRFNAGRAEYFFAVGNDGPVSPETGAVTTIKGPWTGKRGDTRQHLGPVHNPQ